MLKIQIITYSQCTLIILIISLPLFLLRCSGMGPSKLSCEYEGTSALSNLYNLSIASLTKKAQSEDCKAKIEKALLTHASALLADDLYPFENVMFHSRCKDSEILRKGQPLPPLGRFVVDNTKEDQFQPHSAVSLSAENISIAYVLLTHNQPNLTQRVISALNSTNTHFLIYVDAKASDTYQTLLSFSSTCDNVYLVPERHFLSWGGFSIVNATMHTLQLTSNLNISYDYIVLLSGTTYPIKSNYHIKQVLSSQPNKIYMDIKSNAPFKPLASSWYQHIECDGFLHRIARFPLLRGMSMYQGSQWFALPRDVVRWLLSSALPKEYSQYAQYIIIPDENYFSTLIMNSPFCHYEKTSGLVFYLFDEWENKKENRDVNKCFGKGGEDQVCGRSPKILTQAQKHLVAASYSLFARKFDESNEESVKLLDYIDSKRSHAGIIERLLWDTNKSPYDQSSIKISDAIEALCVTQIAGRGIGMTNCTIPVDHNEQVFVTNGCVLDDSGALACTLQTVVRNSTKCMTTVVEDRRLISEGRFVTFNECQGKWNQLFYFPEENVSGPIYLKAIDISQSQDRSNYCLEKIQSNPFPQIAVKKCNYGHQYQSFIWNRVSNTRR